MMADAVHAVVPVAPAEQGQAVLAGQLLAACALQSARQFVAAAVAHHHGQRFAHAF
jgi:hypothetical protein